MPRVNPKRPPPGKSTGEWIQRVLRSSESEAIPALLKLPENRTVGLRQEGKLNLELITHKLAVAWHRASTEPVEDCCVGCTSGNGPFLECIMVPPNCKDRYHLFGKCTNCFYTGRACSLTRQDFRASKPNGSNLLLNTILSMLKETTSQQVTKQEASPSPPRPPKRRKIGFTRQDQCSQTLLAFGQSSHFGLESTSGAYSILGLLSLPEPAESGLVAAHVDLAESLRPWFRQLQSRDMTALNKSVTSLMQDFERFSQEEVQIWRDREGIDLDERLLVRPSGSLQSPVAHHLHQPSFTTVTPLNGETLDVSNGCIRLIHGNGFTADNSFLFDHIHRRDQKSNGMTTYPQSVVEAHEALTWKYMESMEAKVEVLYGKYVQERLMRDSRLNYVVLPLWGKYEGVLLLAIREDSFHNRQEGYHLRRVVMLSPHPQRFFYEKYSSPLTLLQDQTMEAIARMLSIQIDPDYWKTKKWLKDPFNTFLNEAMQQIKLLDLDLDLTASLQKVRPATVRQKLESLDSSVPSNSDVRKTLPQALATLTAAKEAGIVWSSEADLPAAVAPWWKLTQQIMLHSVAGPELPVTKASVLFRKEFENLATVECLHKMILHQQQVLAGEDRQLQDLFHSDFLGQQIKLKCPHCGSENFEPDKRPRWSTRQPGKYFPMGRLCKSRECQHRTHAVVTIPCDESVEVTSSLKSYSKQPAPFNLKPYQLTADQIREQSLPSAVRIHCTKCQRSVFEDHEPRYNRGKGNPLYISTRRSCRHCKIFHNFVPVDKNILFIRARQLQQLLQRFNYEHELITDILLQSCQPSTSRC